MTARINPSNCPVPAWLPGGHAQTLYSALFAPHPHIGFVRERTDTPDGDFLDFDWAGPGLLSDRLHDGRSAPREPGLAGVAAQRWAMDEDWIQPPADQTDALILFHGLEGSSMSHYSQAIAHFFRARGWFVVVANFRGCSGFPNRMARAYYSGDSAEIAFMLDHVRKRLPDARWHAVGVSMGGNALLKYLGEAGGATGLAAAAGVSVPMNLPDCGKCLSDTFLGRQLYSRYFLKTIKKKIVDKAKRFPGFIDVMRIQQLRNLRDLDDLYTAPMHGYRNALDYWTRASSRPLLPEIRVPTLLLNARNDPFIPQASLPGSRDCSDTTLLHQPALGGHAGFTTGPFPGHLSWLPTRLAQFFETGQ